MWWSGLWRKKIKILKAVWVQRLATGDLERWTAVPTAFFIILRACATFCIQPRAVEMYIILQSRYSKLFGLNYNI